MYIKCTLPPGLQLGHCFSKILARTTFVLESIGGYMLKMCYFCHTKIAPVIFGKKFNFRTEEMNLDQLPKSFISFALLLLLEIVPILRYIRYELYTPPPLSPSFSRYCCHKSLVWPPGFAGTAEYWFQNQYILVWLNLQLRCTDSNKLFPENVPTVQMWEVHILRKLVAASGFGC